jgi:hypothetical protein
VDLMGAVDLMAHTKEAHNAGGGLRGRKRPKTHIMKLIPRGTYDHG